MNRDVKRVLRSGLLFSLVCFFLAAGTEAASGGFRFTDPAEWSSCQAVMLIAIASMSMNLFLLFRMMQRARRTGLEMDERLGGDKEKSVLQYIEELRHQLKRQQEEHEARERELNEQVTEWRTKYLERSAGTGAE